MMKARDVFTYGTHSLAHSQLRTWLTILGIVIGISAVIVLVSIGQGLNQSVQEQLSQFGTSTIIVVPVNLQAGSGFRGPNGATSGILTTNDVELIRKIADVDMVSPTLSQRAVVDFKGKNITASVSGIEPSVYQQVFSEIVVGDGRYLSDSDVGAVVLGNDMAATGFGKNEVKVNNRVDINGKPFRVVGILKKTGNVFASVDSGMFMTYTDAKDLFSDRLLNKEVNSIVVKAKDGSNVDEVADEIKVALRNKRGEREGEEDFGLVTPSFINSTVGSITSLLTVFLGAIAAISLIVGGVGIMNTMFMAVVERTREIGTLKAIGAKRDEILAIFLVESGIIGLIGGVIGVVLSIAVLLAAEQLGAPVYISPFVIAGAFLISFLIGMVSGFVPSWNASKVSPLEALRYE